jgi:cytochrome b6-f complex iron-sulfur subunit
MSDPEKPASGNQPPRPPDDPITRRDFFNEVASAALGTAGAGALVVTYRYLSPNVLFEPPSTFKAGQPDQFPVNSVTYFADQEVYVVRTPQGFFAESAICTHLGCITAWNPTDNLIECPCHGSHYRRDGVVVAGPAPRPLPHFAIRLEPDGELLVDKLEIVRIDQFLRV